MKRRILEIRIFFLLAMILLLRPVKSFSQGINAWGGTFDCAVDWFVPCVPGKALKKTGPDKATNKDAEADRSATASPIVRPNGPNLPLAVKNVVENPSPETARQYVLWLREANEKLARASDYIAQAERELRPVEGVVGRRIKKKEEIESRGLVGLYYFFSPNDPSAAEDAKVLNKVWREEQVGVVGIPVSAKEADVLRYIKETHPLFPVRKGEEEVRLIEPKGTPDLYLALPLQKKIFRVGPAITERAIEEALGRVVDEMYGERERGNNE